MASGRRTKPKSGDTEHEAPKPGAEEGKSASSKPNRKLAEQLKDNAEYAEALLLGKVLEDAAPEGERHCHTILVVLGGSAITGLGSRGASGWLRLMFEGRPGIDAKGAKQEPEKDSAEIAGPSILKRRQIRAAMRTKYRGNAHWLGAKWAVPHALAGITIPTVCLGRNISKPATEAKGQTIITGLTTIAFAPSFSYQHIVRVR